jgi:hypothetical protein
VEGILGEEVVQQADVIYDTLDAVMVLDHLLVV